jgi:hypothetical protein
MGGASATQLTCAAAVHTHSRAASTAIAPCPPVAVKVGVLLVAVSWHLAGDGPATVLLDVEPHAIETVVATAAVRVRRALFMVVMVLLA